MPGDSRVVTSSQQGLHPRLRNRVRTHLNTPWRSPVTPHNRRAFERADHWRRQRGEDRPLILDGGCGTGRASVGLAEAFPDALVLGLDKSAARLERATRRFDLPGNLLLLRTDCADFWRLARSAGWRLNRHYLLYPNPWPKPAHLGRRWHGHPVFPDLLALGGYLEVRSNWRPYLEEFALALELAGHGTPLSAPFGLRCPGRISRRNTRSADRPCSVFAVCPGDGTNVHFAYSVI